MLKVKLFIAGIIVAGAMALTGGSGADAATPLEVTCNESGGIYKSTVWNGRVLTETCLETARTGLEPTPSPDPIVVFPQPPTQTQLQVNCAAYGGSYATSPFPGGMIERCSAIIDGRPVSAWVTWIGNQIISRSGNSLLLAGV